MSTGWHGAAWGLHGACMATLPWPEVAWRMLEWLGLACAWHDLARHVCAAAHTTACAGLQHRGSLSVSHRLRWPTCHAASNSLLPAPVPPAAFSRNLDMQCGSPRRSASEKPSNTAASTRRRRSLGGSLPLLAAAAGGTRWRRRWRLVITRRAAGVYSFSATSSLGWARAGAEPLRSAARV